MGKLSVIVPVFNEAVSVVRTIVRVKALPIDKEIIVVDDGSTDGTGEILKKIKGINRLYKTYFFNQGKGFAVRCGLFYAGGNYVVVQDADTEYDPADIPRLLAVADGGVVYGSRILGKGEFPWRYYVANRFLTLLTNLLYGGHLTDMETGYKLIPTSLMQSLDLRSSRFEIEVEITAKLLKLRQPIKEVPITYTARRHGKKLKFKDGLRALWALAYWKVHK